MGLGNTFILIIFLRERDASRREEAILGKRLGIAIFECLASETCLNRSATPCTLFCSRTNVLRLSSTNVIGHQYTILYNSVRQPNLGDIL